jgi:hypothetical protein
MNYDLNEENNYIRRISESNLSIYDIDATQHSNLVVPNKVLENILRRKIVGYSLAGFPNRTKSKVLKEVVCGVLGYPVPEKFKRTRPRFPGQILDVYIQKSNNLQIWNDEIDNTRRYAIFGLNNLDMVTKIRIINGEDLVKLDNTGKLTTKYQASIRTTHLQRTYCSEKDTQIVEKFSEYSEDVNTHQLSPISLPNPSNFLCIKDLFIKLQALIGTSFDRLGATQERNRAALLHEKVTKILGYEDYHDNGQFPDITNQLLEIKLQTSQTIDLGSALPDSTSPLGVNYGRFTYRDIRYAIFHATLVANQIEITNLYLVSGEDFFNIFTKFGGNIKNSKIQIPLPTNFFD